MSILICWWQASKSFSAVTACYLLGVLCKIILYCIQKITVSYTKCTYFCQVSFTQN